MFSSAEVSFGISLCGILNGSVSMGFSFISSFASIFSSTGFLNCSPRFENLSSPGSPLITAVPIAAAVSPEPLTGGTIGISVSSAC